MYLNSRKQNNTSKIGDIKKLTAKFTESFLNGDNTNLSNKLMKSKYLSIQISKSTPEQDKKTREEALKNGLSMINFDACTNFLKGNGHIKPAESISYQKTDWSSELSGNSGSSNSVSYALYTANGTIINMSLCASTFTDIQVPLKN